MNLTFVKTSNVKRFYRGLSALRKRGASEACIMVLDGEPGLGKTETMRHFVAETDSIYVRAKTDQSINWLLSEILNSLGETSPHSRQARYDRVVHALAMRKHEAAMSDQIFALILDEGDGVSSNRRLLESLRDISDDIELPTVVVGMKQINNNLKRFPAFSSRVSQRVTFEPATLEDVHAMIETLCEVPVSEDVCRYIHQFSKGYNREIVDAIAKVERIGRRQGVGSTGLTLAELSGQSIMQDRRTSKPLIVPEVV